MNKKTYTNYLLEVVIPAFNAEKYIAETLDSIFKQKTNFKFLVHVSDDCSSDSTFAICEKYKKIYSNLKLTRQQINLGMTKNQHFVITNSDSKYISYVDSDDIFISDDYLQMQVDFLEKHEDVVCVFSNNLIYNESEETEKIRLAQGYKPPVKFDLHYFFKKNIAITNSAMVFRQKYNDKIPDSFTNYFQYDWLLHIYHGLNGFFGFNDFVGTKYRVHSNNATNIKYAEKKFLDGISLINNIKIYLPEQYHKYFNHPLYELNSLSFFYLRERKIIKFFQYYYLWLRHNKLKKINFRDQFWLFRQSLFRK
jgi:glycosyltransferase involved in cell wall biosynthesis